MGFTLLLLAVHLEGEKKKLVKILIPVFRRMKFFLQVLVMNPIASGKLCGSKVD